MFAMLRFALVLGLVVVGGFQLIAADEKGGTVVGAVTEKGKDWLDVKADGEEKARRYTLMYKGGVDKAVQKAITDVPVGSRVKLDWKFQEKPRVVKLEVLKKAEKK